MTQGAVDLLEPMRQFASRLRCSVCGGHRVELSESVYRLCADDGATMTVAALVCRECRQVRLFEIESSKE